MIITEKVEIKISRKTITHFRKLGYELKLDDIIYVKPTELTDGSHIRIDVKCDICGKEKNIAYQKYIKNIKNGGFYACSSKCAKEKIKQTSLNKFGSEYYTQTDEYKKRYRETCLNKYGVEHHTQNDGVKDKAINTNLKKYGVDNPSKSPLIKEKIKQTFIDRYGVDNISKLDSIKKIISDKVNDDIDNINKLRKNTLIHKYDVDNPSKLDFVKEKKKMTYISKYGVSTPLILPHVKKLQIQNRLLNWKNGKVNNDDNIIDIDLDKKEIIYKCEKNHICNMNYKTYYNRRLSNTIICTVCNTICKSSSGLELQLLDFIKENYNGEIITNTKSIINPYELDIYLPELELAFEFNGVYWHNELNKDNDYHLNKTNMCSEKNIHLVHVWEDDWIYKQDIIKSMILNKLQLNNNRIFGRKCIVKEVTDNRTVRNFLNDNHLQGFVGSKVKLGLYYNDELVSLMTFGKLRNNMNSTSSNEHEYELLRFCNKLNTTVIGGASKLFKYFTKNYTINGIISYADRNHSNGNLYKQLGFKLERITKPNYYYIIDGIKHYRYNFRKDILVKQGYDPNKTEHEIMLERKIYRIYNSGNYKFVY